MKTNRQALPPLPINWHWKTIGQVADIETQTLVPESGVKYLYVGLENIESDTGTLVGVQEVDGKVIRSQKYYFDAGNVLYGKLRPYLNKVALPDFAGICSTDILPLRPKPHVIRSYIVYWLKMNRFLEYAKNNAIGTKMPRLGPSQLLNALIPIPPLPVQERIVQILQKADEIRRKRKEALELADAMLPATFIGMFGDPKENPHGFELVPLGKLAEVRSGVTKGRKFNGQRTIEVPYLRVANVQDGYLDLSEIKTIRVLPEDVQKYHLERGDILMTEGGDPDKLGRGCIWHIEVENCIHQNHVFRVRTDRLHLAPEYLAALLRTQYAKEYFLRCAKRSSNLASINSTQVKAFLVPVPHITLQAKFVSVIEQWSRTTSRLAQNLKETVGLMHSLMQRAFSGELIAEWEAANAATIVAQTAFHERLPQMVILAFLAEKLRRSGRTGAEATILVTALMKYVFLFQMEGASRRTLYRFVPYHYGPFAKELYADLQALQSQGIVNIDNGEEDKTKITLADPQKAQVMLADLSDGLKEDVNAILNAYGDMDHNALLKTVYEKYPAYAQKSRLQKARSVAAAKAQISVTERPPFHRVEPREEDKYRTCVPLLTLRAAAGGFGEAQAVEPEAWVEPNTSRKLRRGLFVAQVSGRSMEPIIPDGAFCLFARPVTGTRQGKIVLVEHHAIADPETGGRYTVKRYWSDKEQDAAGSWRHREIRLEPLNPDFAPIILNDIPEDEFHVIAELVEVLGK